MAELRSRERAVSQSILPTPQPRHPYLSGNFAPIHQTLPLTSCTYIGDLPEELSNGEYVRNGSNPVTNHELGRDAHWFDGDGMLSGVLFSKDPTSKTIQPQFVNQYVLTDVFLSARSSRRLRTPILPSIATLVNPVVSIFYVTVCILRTLLLVLLSHLPGSKQRITRISVANTNIVYHDGRALATCESGPPMRIHLPSLETVGWYNGNEAEGEKVKVAPSADASATDNATLGQDAGILQFMREWTTAHPKVDPTTKEMLMFHSSFAPPYVQYSIIPSTTARNTHDAYDSTSRKLLNSAVPGVTSAKMMHDFGVSSLHTVIMDLPLSLDPVNQVKGKPPVAFDDSRPSRFGVFPRHHPEDVRWYETDACCIFHTANTWDEPDASGRVRTVDMLACRLTSATLVFAAGNIAPPPKPRKTVATAPKRMPFFAKYDQDTEDCILAKQQCETRYGEEKALLSANDDESAIAEGAGLVEDQCRLYYYSFSLVDESIEQQWALSTIPFEFPSVRPEKEMQQSRYVYGCTTTSTSFGAALGKATKIDALVKMDAATLIARGKERPPPSVNGCVDNRTMTEVLANQEDPLEPIKVFVMPTGWYAQEPRFVPGALNRSEDDGFLLFYAFDESQLLTDGEVPPDESVQSRSVSELWIVDAKSMKKVIARVRLPQRVPYGLHGTWFNADQIAEQRPIDSLRSLAGESDGEVSAGLWMALRDMVEGILK